MCRRVAADGAGGAISGKRGAPGVWALQAGADSGGTWQQWWRWSGRSSAPVAVWTPGRGEKTYVQRVGQY